MRRLLPFLYALMVVVLMGATWAERLYGSEVAARQVWHSLWFMSLWALLAVGLVAAVIRFRLWRHRVVLLLHLSFLLMLLGAALTFCLGRRGHIHLQPGQEVSSFVDEEYGMPAPMPMSVRLDSFRIRLNRRTHAHTDYVSYLHVDGHPVRVSMNRVCRHRHYRLYQSSYDDDGGSWLTVSHDPWGIGITYAGYLCWGLAVLLLLLHPRLSFRPLCVGILGKRHRQLVGGLAFAIVLLLLLYLSRWCDDSVPLPPVLASPLLFVHVSLVMAGYALLALLFLCGWVGLLSVRCRVSALRVGHLLLYPAICFLGSGIFVGAYWANQSWGRYWAWDPKEVWALVTFMLYAVPLHERLVPCLRRPLCFHIYAIVAFLAVLMTYFGVNLLLGGLHSYGV